MRLLGTSRCLMSFVTVAAIGLAVLEPPSSFAARENQSGAYMSFWFGGFDTYSDFYCRDYYVTVETWANVQQLADDGAVSSYRERGFFGSGECRTVADRTP